MAMTKLIEKKVKTNLNTILKSQKIILLNLKFNSIQYFKQCFKSASAKVLIFLLVLLLGLASKM